MWAMGRAEEAKLHFRVVEVAAKVARDAWRGLERYSIFRDVVVFFENFCIR